MPSQKTLDNLAEAREQRQINNEGPRGPKAEEDFGFTFEYSIDTEELYSRIREDNKKLVRMKALILPLLEELNKDTNKPMIKWSNRKTILDGIIREINEICP